MIFHHDLKCVCLKMPVKLFEALCGRPNIILWFHFTNTKCFDKEADGDTHFQLILMHKNTTQTATERVLPSAAQ